MKLFSNIDKFWQRYKSITLYSRLAKKQDNGTVKPFDQEFYKKLSGMYYNGIPVYYYLIRINIGKCYDCSAILGLALGDCKICRGNLRKAPTRSGNYFGHGWVEKDGFVYDTTWQIIADKHTYYKLFGASQVYARDSKEFFEDCKGMSSWEIHDKKYYEENYIPMDSLLIFQVRELEKFHLVSPISPISTKEDKEIAKIVLEDLPNVEIKSNYTVNADLQKQ